MKAFKWVVINSAFAALAWFGVHGVTGAGNVFCFLTWLFAIMQCIVVGNKELCAKAKAMGRSVPRWLCVTYDIALLVFLLWHGWWFSAVAVVLMAFSTAAVFDAEKEAK